MRYLISVTLCTFLLSACGTNNYRYESEKNSGQWQGRNIQALQKQWGDADQTLHTRSGNSYYVYTTNAGGNFFTATKSNFAMGSSATTDFADFPSRRSLGLKCTTLFKTNAQGTITAITHSGSNCGGEWTPK